MSQSLRQHLLTTLQALPPARRYLIAFSGGLDSTVLLHLMASLRDRFEVAALHVDHSLSAHSTDWSLQCRALCERLRVPFELHRVEVREQGEHGLEAAARHARYRAFEAALGEGEMLLGAHHQDDQAETLLLQLLRGGGVHGMAGMPLLRRLGRGWLARPLLDVARADLLAYAKRQGLDWIEDPSNRDTRLERNYLRHELIPLLAQRRAGVGKVLARSATHFAENAELLDELAATDLAACRQGEGIAISMLSGLSAARQRNLLRYFLREQGLPLPDHRRLQAILDDLLPAASDAQPRVVWPGAEVRRYRDTLYAMAPLPPLPAPDWVQAWDGKSPLHLPHGLGDYRVVERAGGLRPEWLQHPGLTLRLRRGGERLRLPGQPHHHRLKHLLQQVGMPPWQRERLPLLYLDDELAQVAGLWTAERFAVAAGQSGLMLEKA